MSLGGSDRGGYRPRCGRPCGVPMHVRLRITYMLTSDGNDRWMDPRFRHHPTGRARPPASERARVAVRRPCTPTLTGLLRRRRSLAPSLPGRRFRLSRAISLPGRSFLRRSRGSNSCARAQLASRRRPQPRPAGPGRVARRHGRSTVDPTRLLCLCC